MEIMTIGAVVAAVIAGYFLNQTGGQSDLLGYIQEKNSEHGEEIYHYIKKYSDQVGVDRALVAAIIEQESDFTPDAVGSIGERGLMQISRIAFTDLKTRIHANEFKELQFSDMRSIKNNIKAGVYYFNYMKNQSDSTKKALAKYNGGFKPPERSYRYADQVIRRYEKIK